MKQLIFKNKNLIWTEKLLVVSFFLFPFLWGIFYDGIACLVGIFFCVLLIGHVKYTKKFVFEYSIKTVAFFCILVGYIFACFFAIDKGMAWLGIGKIMAVTIFYLLVLQIKKEVVEMCIQTVYYTGIVMVLICVVAYFIPNIKDLFFQARRMGGFFQYSNSFAFFLLIGIVLILVKDVYKKWDILKLAILLLGLLWSGSRSVLFLFGISIFILAWKKRTHRKWIVILGITTLLFIIAYTMLTGDVQNIGRIFTTSLQSSTLLGRVLYNIDAIKIVMKHTMGLGALGYSYIQQAEQTGVYTTMFVHNDILQMGLDGGILALISFSIWLFGNLFDKNLEKRKQGILALFLLHILIDFDLQYTYLFFVLILIVHSGKEHEKTLHAFKLGDSLFCIQKTIFSYFIVFCTFFLFYMGIANMVEETGNHRLALKVYPWNTESLTTLMLSSNTIEEVEQYADRILQQNSYSYAAYNMKAIVAFEQNNYEDMIRYKKKALSVTRYEIAEYQDYIVMLKKAIDDSIDRNDTNDYQMYVNDLLEVPNMLKGVEKQTHWLAWKLRDSPKLTLGEEYVEYIDWYRRLENE